MKLGYFGIGSGPCADPEVAARAARAAEAAGFESLWTGEHVVLPDPQAPPSPVPAQFPMLDPGAILAFLAGVTTRIRLGTGIIILPQRNPLVLAKQLASVDVLSRGRLIFGVGVGYLEAEFEALGIPFRRKGARTDEYIDAIRALWTQERPEFRGNFVSFGGIQARPRPVQQPCPPIVVGGHSPGALRRAVERGNGWYGFALAPEATEHCLEGLREAQRRHVRPPEIGPLEISVTPGVALDRGSLRRYAELGVDRLIPLSRARTGEEVVAFLEETADLAAGAGAHLTPVA
jgi:probable F420-dependent oxidoreductase